MRHFACLFRGHDGYATVNDRGERGRGCISLGRRWTGFKHGEKGREEREETDILTGAMTKCGIFTFHRPAMVKFGLRKDPSFRIDMFTTVLAPAKIALQRVLYGTKGLC